jgi:hypothetical protein
MTRRESGDRDIWIAAAVLLLAFAPLRGQPPTEMHAPKDGKYSAKFPGKPKDTQQNVTTDLGKLKVNVALFANADGNAWWVSFTDYPADAIKPDVRSKLIDAARDAMKGTDGKFVEEKDMEFGPAKLPGREVKLDRSKYQIRVRFLIRDQRMYQVAVMGPGEFVTGKDATAFLDSFEVK